MKLEPKEIADSLPRDSDPDWVPTASPCDEEPFADSTRDLARVQK